MKKTIVLVLVAITLVVAVSTQEAMALFKPTKFTIIAIDEQGLPLSGVNIGVGLEKNTGWGTDSSGQNGITDAEGKLSFSGQSNGHITYGGRKNDYYDSYYDYDFNKLGIFGWEPWNPDLKIVMRKIENPVPMYARDTNESILEIPVVGKDIGFDLVAFDWVIPFGRGTVPDFLFNVERRVVDRKNFDATLTVVFPNKFNGIQMYKEIRQYGSQFHLPRFAPKNGYERKIVLREWRNPGDGSVKRNVNFQDADLNYFFRVRAEEKEGQFIKAMYGKITGPMDFSAVHSKTAKIYFKYYLNPDYTRNLEFDPKRNLFGNLPDLERVTEP